MSIIFHGATVEWGTDGATYTEIPKAKGAPVPSTSRNYVDVTHLQSPGGYREYIKGLRDVSEITIPCGYDTAGYQQALTYSESVDPIYFRVTLPLQSGQSTTGDRFEFQAFVEPSIPESDDPETEVTMELQLRVTGQPTFTAGA